MGHGAHEDEHAVEGERDEEEIEISIVPLSDTVTHPRAVVVKPLHTLVTDAAVARSIRSDAFTICTEHHRVKNFHHVQERNSFGALDIPGVFTQAPCVQD